MEKFYITTSIAYTNAKPHIGFALELLQADSLARYKRKEGFDVFFLTGTDEHGSKIVKTAEKAGKEPQKFVDEISEEFVKLTKELNISNDYFIRTTDKEKHWPGVELLWKKIEEKGDIYKKKYKGLYCSGCESFKREKELTDGKCPDHGKVPEVVEEENYFFKLSKFSDRIENLIEEDKIKIFPENRKKEMLNFLKEGVEDISVSRSVNSLKWGIPVPGDNSQVLYVWLDALTNYISAIGYGRSEKDFKEWWPADLHCVGKDILRFHAVIWIGMLLSAGIEVPKSILVHGFITSDGKKMSKSLGNVIDPFDLIKEYGVEPVRYYFLKEIPVTGDGDFSHDRFLEVYNSELADGLGNLLSRSIALAGKNKVDNLKGTEEMKDKVQEVEKEVSSYMNNNKINEALNEVWKLIHFTDKYIEKEKPWEDSQEKKDVIGNLLYALDAIANILESFLPETSSEIKRQIKTKERKVIFPKFRNV